MRTRWFHLATRAAGRPRRLADLARHECVLYRVGGSGAKWWLSGPPARRKTRLPSTAKVDVESGLPRPGDVKDGIAGERDELRTFLPSRITFSSARPARAAGALGRGDGHGESVPRALTDPALDPEPAAVGFHDAL